MKVQAEHIIDLVQCFQPFIEKGTESADNLSSLMIKGDFNDVPSLEEFNELFVNLARLDLVEYLTVQFDEEESGLKSLREDYLECINGSTWYLNFNKPRFEDGNDEDLGYLFFMSRNAVLAFLKIIKPFKRSQRIFEKERFHLFIPELSRPLIGAKLLVTSIEPVEKGRGFSSNFQALPDKASVARRVRVGVGSDLLIDTAKFAFESGEKEFSEIIRPLFIQNLCASLVELLESDGNVTLSGVLTIDTKLSNGMESVSSEKMDVLKDTVTWIYEGVFSTRYRLFIDRVILEYDNDESFLSNLLKNSSKALSQAIEQFQFVIEDRRDQYFKELQTIISEVKKQTDLYFDKLRNLLVGFSRDVLAAIFLFGISLITKVVKSDASASKPEELSYLFGAIGIYLIGSWLIQSILMLADARTAKKHLTLWLSNTRVYTSKQEQSQLVDSSLNRQTRIFIWLYIGISLLYIFMGIFTISLRKSIVELI